MRARKASEMGQAKGTVLVMQKPVGAAAAEQRREGTTGQVVSILPRVWATAGDGTLRRVQAAAEQLSEVAGAGSRRRGAQARCRQTLRQSAADAAAETEVAFYRKYTEALLRRYQRLRMGMGRVPSPMDREMFRGRMSHYRVRGFDDAVIFCADVERCLGSLNGEDQRLLTRIAIQEYTLEEASGLLGMSLRSCIVLYRRALDRSTRLLLASRLLEPHQELSSPGSGSAQAN